jgi:hypothetical protein
LSCPHTPDALLGEADPAHVSGCADCALAVREGEKLHALLGRSRLPAPAAAALQRASAQVIAELRAGSRAEARGPAAVRAPRKSAWAVQGIAAVAAFAAPLFFLHHRDASGWTAAIVVLAASAILAATAGTIRAGALVVLAASAGFAVAEGGIPGFSGAGLEVNYACFCLELAAAALPLGAALWMARSNLRPGALAQAAAAGALAGQAALNLCCGAHNEASHLWTFHVSGVAAAGLAGWVLEGRLTRARATAS